MRHSTNRPKTTPTFPPPPDLTLLALCCPAAPPLPPQVVVSPSTVKVIEARRSQGQSLWRVSSTLFSHIASDQVRHSIERMYRYRV